MIYDSTELQYNSNIKFSLFNFKGEFFNQQLFQQILLISAFCFTVEGLLTNDPSKK